jgi:hypothetical protein
MASDDNIRNDNICDDGMSNNLIRLGCVRPDSCGDVDISDDCIIENWIGDDQISDDSTRSRESCSFLESTVRRFFKRHRRVRDDHRWEIDDLH